MAQGIERTDPGIDGTQGDGLPSRLRLLCMGGEEPSWVSLRLQFDAEGCSESEVSWVSSPAQALGLLRSESYDCLLIAASDPPAGCGDGWAIDLLRAIRAGACEDPLLVVACQADDALWAAVHELDAELLVTPRGWGSRVLLSAIRRAMERVQRVREIHRLTTSDRRRLLRERDEAEYLLGQQRQIIQELEHLARLDQFGTAPQSAHGCGTAGATAADSARSSPPVIAATVPLPVEFDVYYQELLRTYVIMGSGNLGAEIAKLAELLSLAGLSPRQTLETHLSRVEQLVRGLGNRSTRHVMARADLLALELMIHLGECYQRKTQGRSGAASPEGMRSRGGGTSFVRQDVEAA